jgi:adenylate cyclase
VAVVGNVGSVARLNHTALGDAVDVASRPESTNKIYGTGIIIGAETRRPAGDCIIVRERDRVAVHADPPSRRSTSSSLSPMKARHLPRG